MGAYAEEQLIRYNDARIHAYDNTLNTYSVSLIPRGFYSIGVSLKRFSLSVVYTTPVEIIKEIEKFIWNYISAIFPSILLKLAG